MRVSREKYREYATKLLKIGVCPENIIGDIVKLCTEDDTSFKYDFSLDNIVAGPDGEIVKINEDQGTIEIYNSLLENSYSVKVYSIATGELCDDGVMLFDCSLVDSKKMFGNITYNQLNDLIGRDYSEYFRSINTDKEILDLRMLEFYVDDLRPKLPGIKESLYKILKRNCKRGDAINSGIAELIGYIDAADVIHYEFHQFISDDLSEDMVEIINRRLKVNNLRKEQQMISKINMIPLTNILEEYNSYNTPKTNKMVKKYTYISSKVASAIGSFERRKLYLNEHLVDSEKTKKLEKKKKMLYLQRKQELEEEPDFGGKNGF